MRKYKVTFLIQLNDNADTEFIENVISEQLERGEDILEGNIEEVIDNEL